MNTKIGVCGIGVVGAAISECFENKNINVIKYDKYKDGGIGNIDKILISDIIFLCLPTLYSDEKKEYDKSSLNEVCDYLVLNKYTGLVVVKSTVEPGSCRFLKNKFNLNILHNPEFLTARSAKKDFEFQNHIVIGGETSNDKNINILFNFYKTYWSDADFSITTYEESELVKIGVNCFYSVKIQFFNELYKLTNTYENASYNKVVETMLKNKWISPNHTSVPGPDGKLSYGGMCFPKDTNALLQLMKKKDVPCKILEATILERNEMRK
jgi:UDPglucose 6-dehydrogenase